MQATRTLNEISGDLRAIEDLLFECDGEITDAQIEEAVDTWLAQIGAERDEKIDRYCYLIDELLRMAEARKVDAARILKYAKVDENNAARLKARLKYFFELHGITKLETAHWKPRIQKNGGKQPLTHLKPVEQWPEEYLIKETVVKPDTDKVIAALEAGEPLEFAQLEERGSHLRLK